MTCRRIETRLDDYLDGTLEAEAQAAVERHSGECGDCARLIERAEALKGALAALPVESPRPEFFEEALAKAADRLDRARPKRVATGWYAGALAAGLATVAIVGFVAGNFEPADSARHSAGVAQVAMAVEETRTINLVFASEEALQNVSLTVDLPDGIELARYPGRDRVQWATSLRPGKNVLPLELTALGGSGGELVATMRRDGKEKVFRISIAVEMG